MPGLKNAHLTGCIDEIIAFCEILDDQKTSYIHEYLIKSGELLIQLFHADIYRFSDILSIF